jgi:cytochrome c-type biogenesis protein CcmE
VSGPPTAITGPVEDESADSGHASGAARAAPPAGATLSSGAAPPTRPPSASDRRQRRRLIIVGAVLVAAFVFLIVKGLGSSLDYFETVDQAVQSKAMLGTKTFRLEGLVVPGTVHRANGDVDFVAAGAKDRIDVVNSTNPPQLFQPNIPVVVVGHFVGDTFMSNQIIVDHTAQYVAKYPARVRGAPKGSTR